MPRYALSIDVGNSLTETQVAELSGEGEDANDLVAFAKAIANSGARLFGADWNAATSDQLGQFEDGGKYLPFIESTQANQDLNAIAVQEAIQTLPTWKFADGTSFEGILTPEALSARTGVAIPKSSQPSFATIADQIVFTGSPLHIPVDAYDPNGNPLTITVTSNNPSLIQAEVLNGSRSLRMAVENRGEMSIELFEKEATTITDRLVELTESGFFNNTASNRILFHRVIDGFVIQTGDPTGTGAGSSSLPNVDDTFNVNLQHNRSGVLSMARTATNDTSNSQFFMTATPQRQLDFLYSIFGQIVEGDSVRAGIGRTEVSPPNSRPTRDVVIQSMSVFDDKENGLIRLTPIGSQSGSATIRVAVTDTEGNTTTQEFTATVEPDTVNSPPFLQPLPKVISAEAGKPLTIQLAAQDVEGDQPFYSVTNLSSTNFNFGVDSTTGLLTVTPPAGFTGTLSLRVGVTQRNPNVNSTDTQIITLDVTPAQTPLIELGVSMVGSPNPVTAGTAVTFNVTVFNAGPDVAQGIVASLPFPSSLTVISGGGAFGIVNLSNGTVTYNIPQLSPGESTTFTISAFVSNTATGTVGVSVTVVARIGAEVILTNNIATALVTINPVQALNSVSGYVYVDTNNDGDRFVNVSGSRMPHLGIPNVLIKLNRLNSADSFEARTDARGFFQFLNLPDGNYALSEVQPILYMDGKDTPGVPFIQGMQENDRFVFFLAGQVNAIEYNFGEVGLVPNRIGKYLTLASAAPASALVATLAANQIIAFAAPQNGTVRIRSAEGEGTIQVAERTGETLVGTFDTQLDYRMQSGQVILVSSQTNASLEFIVEDFPAIAPGERTNLFIPYDVNADGVVSPLDALLVINRLNQSGSSQLFRNPADRQLLDVNSDGRVSPIDALLVIERINRAEALSSAEGESSIQPSERTRAISTQFANPCPVNIKLRKSALQISEE